MVDWGSGKMQDLEETYVVSLVMQEEGGESFQMLSPASKPLSLPSALRSSALESAHGIPLPMLCSVPARGCAGVTFSPLGLGVRVAGTPS